MMNLRYFFSVFYALKIKEFIAKWPFVDYGRRVFPIHPLPGPTIHSLHAVGGTWTQDKILDFDFSFTFLPVIDIQK